MFTSRDAHYSIVKLATFMGLGSDNVISIKTDESGKMKPEELEKAILKVLQEHFSGYVHVAYIIKPDNFWQKQRTSLASHKYKFEVNVFYKHLSLWDFPQTRLRGFFFSR